jgi:hypothetical protein
MLMRGARSLSLVRSLALRGASVEALERVTPALLPALAALEIEAAPGTERAVGAALERMAGQLERVTLRGQIGAGLTCLGAAGPLAALDLGGAVLDAASEAWLEAEGERGRLRALGLVGSSLRGWRLGQLLGGASRWPGLERLAVRAWDRHLSEGALEAVRMRAAGGLVGLRLCADRAVARWPDALDLEEVEVESCSSAPLKIERVVSARTRRLVMHPAQTSLEVIEAPALEDARLWGAGRALVDALARTPLPRLRRLSLCVTGLERPGGDAFSGLYGPIQWPSLTQLELGGGALRLHELGALCRSPLAGQLDSLRLRFIGDNIDGWSPRELVRVFEPHREQLRALRRLEIAGADAAAVRRAVDGTWLGEVLRSPQPRS